jgi:tRNA dimethylallyltransferase
MYKEIAIIAPTASGKTALSIDLAHKTNSIVLSLDSLSVYKEIDIASAKPTLKERDGIVHFGIDEVYPDEKFDVMEFIDCYYRAKEYAKQNSKNLIIVGGTGFYLKAMVSGISPFPTLSSSTIEKVKESLIDIEDSYQLIKKLDPSHTKKIEKNDKYRIQKALEIYFETNLTPSEYFKQNKPKPIIKDLCLFQIETDVQKLRDRIAIRTKQMLQNGIIDEVRYLEKKYSRSPNCMKSIGIKEVLEYFDKKLDLKELEYWITTHTAQLAKRQRTFNKSQFQGQIKGDLKELRIKILEFF